MIYNSSVNRKYSNFFLSFILCLPLGCKGNTTQIEGNVSDEAEINNQGENVTEAEKEEVIDKKEVKYNIYFLIEDKIYKTLSVNSGETPNIDNPTKEEDEFYRYEFYKWSPEITPANKDTTYVAVFNKIRKQHVINWIVNGKLYQSYSDLGSAPSYPFGEPTKEPDGNIKYVFDGWEPEISTVTKDATYVAKFKQVERNYTVTFIINDEIVQKTEYKFGETPVYNGSTPTREEDVGYTYKFNSWYPEIKPVDRDIVYVANFDSFIKSYTIKFKFNSSNISTYTLKYNDFPAYTGNLIQSNNRVNLNGKTYVFKGWDPEIRRVDSNQTYVAKLEERNSKITISFEPNGGSINDSVQIDPFTTLDATQTFEYPNYSVHNFFVNSTDVGDSNGLKRYSFTDDSVVVPLYFATTSSNGNNSKGFEQFNVVNYYRSYDYVGPHKHFSLPRYNYPGNNAGCCDRIYDYSIVMGNNNNRDGLTFYLCDYLNDILGPKPLHTINELDTYANNKSCIEKVVVSSSHNHLRGNGSTAIISKDGDILVSANEYTILTNDIKEIGTNAFSTTLIENIYMPDSIQKINKEAFSYCGNLTNVVLSKNLTSIGKAAFKNAKSLNSIWIPSSVKEIPADCFTNSNDALIINYEGSEEMWNNISKNDSNLSNFVITFNKPKPEKNF